MTANHLYLIAALAIPACAPASGTSGAGEQPRRASTVLTAGEIIAADADRGTLYEAISRLRSNWLTRETRSFESGSQSHAVVFVEGRRFGELESLRDIDASQITEVRYYSAAEAGGKFGIQSGLAGVIEVTMKQR